MVKKRGEKKNETGSLGRWLFVLGAICLLFLFGKLILSYRKRVWEKGRLNFILANELALVFSLSPEEENLTVIKIPQKTYIEVTRGFGLYKIESVYPLGELEERGGELLAETVQEFLGISIEGYLRIRSRLDALGSRSDKEEIIELKRKITSWRVFFKEDLETNFSLWDIVKIWLNLKKISAGKIRFIDLEERMVLTEFSLLDGGVGKKGDPLLIDNLLKDFFFEPEIRKEKISVEVLNGTDCSGLGKKAARMITNLGAKVVKVADGEEKVEQCQIKGNEKALKSFTSSKIKKIFGCQEIKSEKEELILIIGADYYRKLFSMDEK